MNCQVKHKDQTIVNPYTYMTDADTAVNTKSCSQIFIKLSEKWTCLLIAELRHTHDPSRLILNWETQNISGSRGKTTLF